MKRAGGWILGLLVVGAMGGGAWFALRGVLDRQTVAISYVESGRAGGPTSKAMRRGAEFALQETENRAGRYRIFLVCETPGASRDDILATAAWFGTSEALLGQGHLQGRPFYVSVFDTHPHEPEGCYRISPGCDRQATSAAGWAKRIGASRVFLLSEPESIRSKAIASAFEKTAPSLGLKIEGSATASLGAVERILALKPDLVFYSGEEAPYGTTTKIFTALRERGFSGRMVTAEADPEVSFLATRPDLLDGTYLVSPFAPAPPDLSARMGFVPGPHVTAGYFAMKAVLETIDRANSIEEEALHRAAATLPSARRPCALYVARNGLFEFVETLP